MRCPRCGNENPETNRFCGMCGATLLQGPASASPDSPPQAASMRSSASAPASTAPRNAAARTAAPPPEASEAPVISGPSFLGLNDSGTRRQGNLRHDSQAGQKSRDLTYLLEDDDEPRGGGGGKFILILLALALAVGLGYLRWKDQGFGWLGSLAGKHATAAAPSPDAADSSSSAPPASSGDAAAPAGTNQPAASAAAQPAPGTASPATAPAETAPASAPPSAAPAPADADSANASANSAANPPPLTPAAETSTPATKDPASDSSSAAKPDTTADAPEAKPAAATKPVPPVDPVSEAQKYIYGRGAPQDCGRGLKILKPAANEANAKAMIEMGALYSAGLCTPRDLPTAYRWFAMALRKQPNNQAVQTDLQKLWSEMTQPERQLAIKLSQ